MRDHDELRTELQAMSATTPLKLSRRQMVSGAASAGLLLATPISKALAQARVTVTEGNFQPIPIAIPNFVPGSQGDNDVAVGIAQVITNNLKRSDIYLALTHITQSKKANTPNLVFTSVRPFFKQHTRGYPLTFF